MSSSVPRDSICHSCQAASLEKEEEAKAEARKMFDIGMDLLDQCHILKEQVEDIAEENLSLANQMKDLTEAQQALLKENRRLKTCFNTEQRLRMELLLGLVKQLSAEKVTH